MGVWGWGGEGQALPRGLWWCWQVTWGSYFTHLPSKAASLGLLFLCRVSGPPARDQLLGDSWWVLPGHQLNLYLPIAWALVWPVQYQDLGESAKHGKWPLVGRGSLWSINAPTQLSLGEGRRQRYHQGLISHVPPEWKTRSPWLFDAFSPLEGFLGALLSTQDQSLWSLERMDIHIILGVRGTMGPSLRSQ